MSETLRVVILEDEAACVRRLQAALATLPDVEVVGVAGDGPGGLELARRTRPDLVFLDIRLPGMDGLEVAQELAGPGGPAIVFATAFADFALPAFDLGAVGYVLKPVEAERVRVVVERARGRLTAAAASPHPLETLSNAFDVGADAPLPAPAQDDAPLRWLWVADGRGRTRIDIDTIERFEAERDYVRIHVGERSWLIRATLQSIADRLDINRFARAHRSLVVNLDAVRGLRRKLTGAMIAVLESGAEAPVGRVYLPELRSRLRMGSLKPAE